LYQFQKQFLSILVICSLLSGNAYSKNISILCTDEKRSKDEDREVVLSVNFDDDGNWVVIGDKKYIEGTKSTDGKITETTDIEINTNKIKILHDDTRLKINFLMMINRLDGSMIQKANMVGQEFNFNYKCQKDDRKF
jgi:hypothetical protein